MLRSPTARHRLHVLPRVCLRAAVLTGGNADPTLTRRTCVHPRHPKKEVNAALDYADGLQLTVERTVAGHKWGRIVCPCGARVSVWSTPRSPENHGRQLRRWVDQHDHGSEEQ